VLSSFSLSHEEVVARRLLISKKNPEEVSVFSAFSNAAVSRKVVGRNAHATIPKGNMGYDQYTVRND